VTEPSIGRIVHYRDGDNGACYAAIITYVYPHSTIVCLTVFPHTPSPGCVRYVNSATYSETPVKGTWCWPNMQPSENSGVCGTAGVHASYASELPIPRIPPAVSNVNGVILDQRPDSITFGLDDGTILCVITRAVQCEEVAQCEEVRGQRFVAYEEYISTGPTIDYDTPIRRVVVSLHEYRHEPFTFDPTRPAYESRWYGWDGVRKKWLRKTEKVT
jgi:hypothetical protein